MKTFRSPRMFLALALSAAFSATAQASDCYSDGVRVGTVQKFSQKGIINKSWEGELVMDGVKVRGTANGAAATNVWKFSVLDPAVAKSIDGVVMSGNAVSLRYCQVMFQLAQTDTPYRITQAVEHTASK